MTEAPKYALVTGASSGIGWHICRELASRNYSIIAVSNQAEQLLDLKSELLKDYQIEVHTRDCDLSEMNAAKGIFDFCQQNSLKVEVLVNNAGMLVYGETVNTGIEKIRAILQLQMNTPVMLCRLFGAPMVQDQNGYILNVSSISALMPYPTISLYGPTKAFLRKFTRALRTELSVSGVNVLCLLPGGTTTSLYDTSRINMGPAMRLGLMKKPELVAKAGVRALFRKRAECVPGLLNKLIMLFIPLIPHALVGVVYRRMKR